MGLNGRLTVTVVLQQVLRELRAKRLVRALGSAFRSSGSPKAGGFSSLGDENDPAGAGLAGSTRRRPSSGMGCLVEPPWRPRAARSAAGGAVDCSPTLEDLFAGEVSERKF